MEDHPHTHPIPIPMGIPIPTAALVFTARCYASAVLATALCPSVRLSVTSRCSTKRITETTSHDSPGNLVFWCQRSPRIRPGSFPGGRQIRWVGQNRRLSTNSWLYLDKKLSHRRGTARCVVSVEILVSRCGDITYHHLTASFPGQPG